MTYAVHNCGTGDVIAGLQKLQTRQSAALQLVPLCRTCLAVQAAFDFFGSWGRSQHYLLYAAVCRMTAPLALLILMLDTQQWLETERMELERASAA